METPAALGTRRAPLNRAKPAGNKLRLQHNLGSYAAAHRTSAPRTPRHCWPWLTPPADPWSTQTVQERPPEGVEVSIRTPLTPARWAAYEPEMQASWAAYCQCAARCLGEAARTEEPLTLAACSLAQPYA